MRTNDEPWPSARPRSQRKNCPFARVEKLSRVFSRRYSCRPPVLVPKLKFGNPFSFETLFRFVPAWSAHCFVISAEKGGNGVSRVQNYFYGTKRPTLQKDIATAQHQGSSGKDPPNRIKETAHAGAHRQPRQEQNGSQQGPK